MSYHLRKINPGEYGKPSKIREELEELEDALDQNNIIMALCELSDIYGALEAVIESYGYSMNDLSKMNEATKRAFTSGKRKPK